MMLNEHGEQFEYGLAETLGMTVARMRQEMSHREYMGWVAYYTVQEALRKMKK